MRVILFGASGMLGAGALREALGAAEVESVLSIGRRSCGLEHPELRELLLTDLFDVAAVEDQLSGYDQIGVVLLTPVLVRLFPFLFTTSEVLGRAMLRIVMGRADRFVLASADIDRVGA